MATLCRSLTNATCVPNSRLCSYYLDRENSNDHTSPATMIAQGSGSLDSKAGCLAGKKWIIDIASAQLERKSYWFCIGMYCKKPPQTICIQRILTLCEFHYCEFHYCEFQYCDFSKLFRYIWLMLFWAKIFHYCDFYDIAKYRKSSGNEIFWPKKLEIWLIRLFPRTKSRFRKGPYVHFCFFSTQLYLDRLSFLYFGLLFRRWIKGPKWLIILRRLLCTRLGFKRRPM